jgi:hypothetical protein
MDAPARFKSAFHGGRETPAPLQAARKAWAGAPLHVAAARMRPPAAPADDDDDWEVAIARAKRQMASSIGPSTPPPLPRDEWAEAAPTPPPLPSRAGWGEMAPTPPPLAARPAPTLRMLERALRAPPLGATHATLDALVARGQRK